MHGQSVVVQFNSNYLKLQGGLSLSRDAARRVKDFSAANPEASLIRLGIGDVTEPLRRLPRKR